MSPSLTTTLPMRAANAAKYHVKADFGARRSRARVGEEDVALLKKGSTNYKPPV